MPVTSSYSDMPSEDREISALSLPPYSTEAEQSILGSLMLESSAWDRIADVVSGEDSYRHKHRLIFRIIANLINENRPADVITVQESLERSEELEAAGEFNCLVTLAQNTPSAANVRRYVGIVHERSIMHQLVEVGTEIARSTHDPQRYDAGQLLGEAENKVFQVTESTVKSKQGFFEMPGLLKEVVERIDMFYSRDNPDEVTGISTGFVDLDKKTSGLQPGNLVVIVGRPSMDKAAFSVNIAERVAVEDKLPVAVFSMETGGAQLVMRVLGSIGRLNQSVLKASRLQDEHWGRLNEVVVKPSDTPVYIDETPSLTAFELHTHAHRPTRQLNGKLGLIIIGYLQLMSGSGRSDSHASELDEVSRPLKALAKKLRVPITALSQLSRTVEQRTDKRPMISDLRESGTIEQDADLIMFIYRDEYYSSESPVKGLAKCIIGKCRSGPVGKVFLTWMGQFTKFDDAAYVPESMLMED